MIKGKLIFIGIMLLIIGGIFALVFLTSLPYTEKTNKGFIIGFASLANKMKSEKIGDVYIFWKKVNSFSGDTLLQRENTIINEINQLKNENPSLEDFKDYCRDYCLLGGEQDNNDYCIPDCMSIELDMFYQNKDIMIKDYNKELNWIKSIK